MKRNRSTRNQIEETDKNPVIMIPNSIHFELTLREPEILDIESGETILLNGYNGASYISRISVASEVFLGEKPRLNNSNNSVLDIEL